MIKKVTLMLTIVTFALCLPMNGFAKDMAQQQDYKVERTATEITNEDMSDAEHNDHPSSDQEREAMEQLMSEWEENGYPDNVGHVMMDNEGKIIIGLVDNSEQAQADIKAMVDAPDLLNFESAKYSYNDLLATHDEISEMMTEQEDHARDIYGVGTGLTTIDGEVTGFGDNGHEFRVVVSVAEDAYDKYVEVFNDTYGDKVYVEANSEPPTDDVENTEGDELNEGSETNSEAGIDHETSENNNIVSETNEDHNESALPATPGNGGNTSDQIQNGIWFSLIALVLIACIVLTIYLIKQNRFTTAKQTTSGENITDTTPVQRAEVISTVKKSNIKPSDHVETTILEMLETENKSHKKEAHSSEKDNI